MPADRDDAACTGAGDRLSELSRSDFVLWPTATKFSLGPDVSFRGEADAGR
jgi:hypothetical protein